MKRSEKIRENLLRCHELLTAEFALYDGALHDYLEEGGYCQECRGRLTIDVGELGFKDPFKVTCPTCQGKSVPLPKGVAIVHELFRPQPELTHYREEYMRLHFRLREAEKVERNLVNEQVRVHLPTGGVRTGVCTWHGNTSAGVMARVYNHFDGGRHLHPVDQIEVIWPEEDLAGDELKVLQEKV